MEGKKSANFSTPQSLSLSIIPQLSVCAVSRAFAVLVPAVCWLHKLLTKLRPAHTHSGGGGHFSQAGRYIERNCFCQATGQCITRGGHFSQAGRYIERNCFCQATGQCITFENIVAVIPILFYHGKTPWKWPVSFQKGFFGRFFWWK